MNFFLDENFPLCVRSKVESQGGACFDVRGTEWEGASDEKLFELAQEKSAIFLTTDKDFFHTITRKWPNHFGAVVIALAQPNSRAIAAKFEWALNYMAKTSIQSQCLLLTDSRLYILPSPKEK